MSKPLPRISAKKYRGLGDVVHSIAQPIAHVLDRMVGTKLVGCGGCAKRRDNLNNAFPL